MPIIKQVAISMCLMALANYAFTQSHTMAEGEAPAEEQSNGYFEIITSIINAYSFEEDEGNVGNEFHLSYWLQHGLGIGLSITTKLQQEGL
ncbi:MAG: hypothetical protein AAF849_15835, partial [Bacteroidota bacterium]